MASSVFQLKSYACAMLYNKLPAILAPQATLAPPSIYCAQLHNYIYTSERTQLTLGCFMKQRICNCLYIGRNVNLTFTSQRTCPATRALVGRYWVKWRFMVTAIVLVAPSVDYNCPGKAIGQFISTSKMSAERSIGLSFHIILTNHLLQAY